MRDGDHYAGPRRPGDIWVVGIILCQMLFGQVPYAGTSYKEVRNSLFEFLTDPQRPELNPSMLYMTNRWLRWIL
ncbi:hypothetical protein M422DRAFT_39050 [Sphaerobolus stellatus SS14]|uniref:Protein kinase domain-containing protein n=1 Tax=Sphaerobolus stellatus (strain SS14) TaxID=990650 RepID=A0A0C9UGZ8_SPHS4|nr:hypothetical protein M422DRAFT_39050 [Sphaerobolus stellatus SS14]